jgi:hypothetical protein
VDVIRARGGVEGDAGRGRMLRRPRGERHRGGRQQRVKESAPVVRGGCHVMWYGRIEG